MTFFTRRYQQNIAGARALDDELIAGEEPRNAFNGGCGDLSMGSTVVIRHRSDLQGGRG
jgi:hypothetical protein